MTESETSTNAVCPCFFRSISGMSAFKELGMTKPLPNIQPLPRHVAIIMDGNGRWAKQRGLPRIEGHRRGAESVRTVTTAAREIGVEFLTLYAFSTENWNRPKTEIGALMRLLKHYLAAEVATMNKNNIRLQVIGRIHDLPEDVRAQLDASMAATANNSAMTLILALSYSGRAELTDAVRVIAERVHADQLLPKDITEKMIAEHLYTRDFPDPDLLIRTSGEMRVSNFLLWQLSYTEFVIRDTLWPDFGREEFYAALEEYSRRQRRFGGVHEPEA
jgi:undecaprenyl diphosphate synthase